MNEPPTTQENVETQIFLTNLETILLNCRKVTMKTQIKKTPRHSRKYYQKSRKGSQYSRFYGTQCDASLQAPNFEGLF